MDYALKWMAVEVKGVDRETRSLEGYASTSMPDYEGEVILPSAWKDSLKRWKKIGSRPKFLAYHQHKLIDGHSPVIGSIEWMEPDDKGLKFRASFANTDLGEEHLELYASGAMDAFSVGFIPQARERDPEKIAKLLERNGIQADAALVEAVTTKAHILEVSCVVVGMNIGATVKAAKAGDEFAGRALARLDAAAGIFADEEGKAKTEKDLGPETFERVEFDTPEEPPPAEAKAAPEPDPLAEVIEALRDLTLAYVDGQKQIQDQITELKSAVDSLALKVKSGASGAGAVSTEPPKANAEDRTLAEMYLADIAEIGQKVRAQLGRQ